MNQTNSVWQNFRVRGDHVILRLLAKKFLPEVMLITLSAYVHVNTHKISTHHIFKYHQIEKKYFNCPIDISLNIFNSK